LAIRSYPRRRELDQILAAVIAFDRVELHITRVSAKTCWAFIRISANDGIDGSGEATLISQEASIRDAARAIVPRLKAQGVGQAPDKFAAGQQPASLAEAAIVSAVDMALWDLHAAAQGRRLVDAFGSARRERIPLYANINRRTVDRAPDGFAASARDALAAGFDAFKIAPFDEVDVTRCRRGDGLAAMQPGLERIAAVRDAIGRHCRLMVDCHWRFDLPTALGLLRGVEGLDLHWIECPLSERIDDIPALVKLRKAANESGIRLAGLEEAIGLRSLRPYIDAGAYDVMMPDVKYIGGLRELERCALDFERHGIELSPHNPNGPISHAASLHAAASMASFDRLEMQFDESPLFDALVSGLPMRSDGHSTLPVGPGLGVALDTQRLRDHADAEPLVWETRLKETPGRPKFA
jgi:galactonate dehydratase